MSNLQGGGAWKHQEDVGEELPLGKLNDTSNPRTFENPPFDPRIYDVFLPEGGKLLRGYIKQADRYTKDIGQTAPYRCKFLYNPSDFSVAYSGANNILPPNTWTKNQAAARLLVPNMQQISFVLLFDRMYEVNALKAPYALDDRCIGGVYVDVQALERCVGITNGVGGILPIPLYLFFGQPDYGTPARTGGSISTDSSLNNVGKSVTRQPLSGQPLAFYGWVTSMSVGYTHFSYNMTPMRCTVSLTFSQLARPASTASANPLEGLEGTVDTGTVLTGEGQE